MLLVLLFYSSCSPKGQASPRLCLCLPWFSHSPPPLRVCGSNNSCSLGGQVLAKFSAKAFSLFTEVFHALPLCHVIGEKIMVVHGGADPWDCH